MKKLLFLFITTAILVSCGPSNSDDTDQENQDTTSNLVDSDQEKEIERKSPRMSVDFTTSNGVELTLNYGSPRVKEREVWGELVPYNEVWRAGADEASAVTFKKDVLLNNQEVKAGTYGMYIIPKENEDWVFIINEEWSKEEHGVWGAYDYKEEKDVVRLTATPEWTEEIKEELSFSVAGDQLIFEWEKVKLAVNIAPINK